MSVRAIAVLAATAALLLTLGAVTAVAPVVVVGMTAALVAGVLVSIKTDDPTRTMHQILLEDRVRVQPVLVEDRSAH
jgi:hypothetical protein